MDLLYPGLEKLDLKKYMEQALIQAELAGRSGELPIGAILVIECEIISRGQAQHRTLHSQIRHAELNAILEGGEKLWNEYQNAILFTTVEPCPLCLGAAVMADIPHIIFGIHDQNVCSSLTVQTNPYIRRHIKSYFGGVLENESIALFNKYDPQSLRCIKTASS